METSSASQEADCPFRGIKSGSKECGGVGAAIRQARATEWVGTENARKRRSVKISKGKVMMGKRGWGKKRNEKSREGGIGAPQPRRKEDYAAL